MISQHLQIKRQTVSSASTPIKKPRKPTNQPKHVLLLERFPYTGQEFHFPEVPTLLLPSNFFENPFALVDELYSKNYQSIGIVKLILPPELVVQSSEVFSRLRASLNGKRLETRKQILNNLKSGEAFEANIAGQTLDEYMRYADAFDQHHKLLGKRELSDELRQNEIEFWSVVDHPTQYEQVKVEYAADLQVSKYATGFEEEQVGNLSKLSRKPNSIFQVLTEKTEMSGISVPWLYLGMKYANFCWHCEDLYLNSMNYMHAGAPKTWYAIPPSHQMKFQEVFSKTYATEIKQNPRLMYDIVCQLNPIELVREGVQVLRTDQKPGEIIFTMGGTFHAGFSHGLNCSEAVNIAPVHWLDEYEVAVDEYRRNGNHRRISFPLDWLLIKIVNMADTVVFSKDGWERIAKKLNQVVEREINYRKTVTSMFENIVEVEYMNKLEKYDRNVCKICQNYMYLSHLFCGKCLKKGCTSHISICACENPKIQLFVRYINSDLLQMVQTMMMKSK